ncbi:hypothetical protein P5673_009391 [Acropora cervicornis]|uniref:Uncharacterized protein n=1 Tax=Acropora cervicornis TaxID=6130 RepID=A0AAD9VA07_ACRCE|nr:hypothetical protein P5673_009391 [Acropora cervicornis]
MAVFCESLLISILPVDFSSDSATTAAWRIRRIFHQKRTEADFVATVVDWHLWPPIESRCCPRGYIDNNICFPWMRKIVPQNIFDGEG